MVIFRVIVRHNSYGLTPRGNCFISLVFLNFHPSTLNYQPSHPHNSFPDNLLSDPHPINPVASILYENSGGEGYPRPSDLRTFRRANGLPRKSFRCNTYEPPRKCCKQKTYSMANSFRCNTYKKQGVGSILRLQFSLSAALLEENLQSFGVFAERATHTPDRGPDLGPAGEDGGG